jgi:hypothetical protein
MHEARLPLKGENGPGPNTEVRFHAPGPPSLEGLLSGTNGTVSWLEAASLAFPGKSPVAF